MTEHDLATLVREHVGSDEPPFAGPENVVARGRRTVRTRRITTGVGVAAVLAVTGALAVPRLSGDSADDGPHGIDLAIQQALDDYDAGAMPGILEDAARTVFSRSVTDLGPAEFAAYGVSVDGKLAPGDYDEASGMSVHFGGSGEHQWWVSVLHAGGETDASDHQKVCDQDVREGTYLACTAEELPDGDVVIERVSAWQKAGPEWGWGLVAPAELELYPSDILWFEHQVEVIKSDTFLTRTVEKVKAPSLAAAEREFLVPLADLAELGDDPQLVIPRPPDPGDDHHAPTIEEKMPSPLPRP